MTGAQTLLDGDGGWRGVNLRLDPSLLPEGFASKAVNMRFRNGIAETREGSMVIAWLNNIVAGNVTPWGTVYGVGVFRDPTTFLEYVLIAADGNVYACLPNNPPRLLSLPSGVTVTARCTFVQCFDVVVCLRGFSADPLVMTDLTLGFQAVTQTLSGTGTLTIPRALRGVNAGNRLWLAREDDTMVASDVQDYTRYSLMNDLRINQGTDDRIVTLVVFGGDIIVLKDKTVHRLFTLGGNLTAVQAEEITRRYGCVAADSAVDCGSDLLWLSQEGVASLTLTEQNEIQAAQGALAGKNRMFSEDIGPLMQQVNGRYAGTAFGVLWQDRYYLGLPKDMGELLERELITNQIAFYGLVPPYTFTVPNRLVVGATYRFTQISATTSAIGDGVTTLTTNGEFVAASTTLVATGTGQVTCGDSLVRVHKGVNTVLAHYDFQNGAWGGYDESAGIGFKFIFTATYTNRQRLFVITPDGFVRLWEEDYTDRLSVPYADVTVSAFPTAGDTVRINGGATITVIAAGSNTATEWGRASSLATARNNFYRIANGADYSYNQQNGSPWSATNSIPSVVSTVADGVFRFYATNGVAPAVVTTGSWSTVSIVVEQQIVTAFETRAYRAANADDVRPMRATLDVQTWNPSYSADLLLEGVNEESAIVAATTRSRTNYTRPFNKAAWVTSNVNNDFDTPYREDYSIQPDTSSYAFTGGDGVRGDMHQAARHTIRLRNRSRACRVRVASTQGRIRLMAVRVEQLQQRPRSGIRV